MNDGAPSALREFLRLQARDQAAIAKHLTPDERRRLLALKERKVSPRARAAPPPTGPDWSSHSPWLAKHLSRLIADADSKTSKLTPAAQTALHDCLLHSTDAPS